MKILYVGYLPPRRGGAALSSRLLLEAFGRLGCRIRAIQMEQVRRPGAADQALNPAAFPVTPVLMPPEDITPGDNPHLEARAVEARILAPIVENEIRADRPDLLFLGMESVVHFLAPLARAHGGPCMARMTGSYANRIIGGVLSAELTQDWLRAISAVDRVVCVSPRMREGLAARGVKNLCVLQNGVDLNQFQPAGPDLALRRRLGIPPDAPVVFHASGLKQVKRPLDLAAAFRLVADRMPSCRLLIAGDGPLRSQIEGSCRQHGLSDRLHLASWVPYPKMPAYFSLADVVVMPSEMEGQSRVYLEAQACGKLLIASDIPAARSVVAHGRSGLLFRKGDPADLADKIVLALSDPKAQKRMEDAALERIRAEHGLDTIARQYYREIHALVGANSTR